MFTKPVFLLVVLILSSVSGLDAHAHAVEVLNPVFKDCFYRTPTSVPCANINGNALSYGTPIAGAAGTKITVTPLNPIGRDVRQQAGGASEPFDIATFNFLNTEIDDDANVLSQFTVELSVNTDGPWGSAILGRPGWSSQSRNVVFKIDNTPNGGGPVANPNCSPPAGAGGGTPISVYDVICANTNLPIQPISGPGLQFPCGSTPCNLIGVRETFDASANLTVQLGSILFLGFGATSNPDASFVAASVDAPSSLLLSGLGFCILSVLRRSLFA